MTGSYLFLVIAALFGLKPVRDSLFLDRFGAVNLPFVTLGYALGVGVFVALVTRLAHRARPDRLVIGTLAVLASNVLVFWWLARWDLPWLYPALYIWVGMFGAIAPAQVWILANDVFTTREAKRVFGVVGAGGILGSVFGGEMVSTLAPRIGTIHLLLPVTGLLVAACVVVGRLTRHRLPESRRVEEHHPPRHLGDSLRLISASPHLRLVAGLVFVTALATTMADFQFKALAKQNLDGDALTSFFGAFYSRINVIGLLIQLFLTGRLLHWMGLGGTILMLPVFLAGGTVAVISSLSLWAAVLLKGSDQALKHSVDRSSRELVYLPVSRSIKVHVKSAIDMVFDRLGDGIAGAILLVIVTFLSLGVRHVAALNLAFLVVWIALAVRLRRSYVDELGRSIAVGRAEAGSWDEAIGGAEAIRELSRSLDSDDEATVLAALDLVGENREWGVRPVLERLAREGSPEIRARALSVLLDPDEPGLPAGVAEVFGTRDRDLLVTCLDVMLSESDDERARRLREVLDRVGGVSRAAWLAVMVRRLGGEFRPLAVALIGQLASPSSPPPARQVAAAAVGMVPRETGAAALLPDLLGDTDSKVASAAARSAAALGDDALVDRVIPLLARAATRGAARGAIQSRGDEAVPALVRASRDSAVPPEARGRIPWVLAGIGSAGAVAALVGMMDGDDPALAAASRDALYEVRLRKADLALIAPRDARRMVADQARRYRELADLLDALGEGADDGADAAAALLRSSVRARVDAQRAALFRVLALGFSPRDMSNCQRSLLEHDRERRANAAELIDNMAPRRLWREILPILYPEEFASRKKTRRGGDAASETRRSAAVLALADDPSPWLRACALQAAGELDLRQAAEPARDAVSDPDPRVRESAFVTVERLAGRERTLPAMTVVEKTVALSKVDLFRDAPPEQLAAVAAVASERTVAAGEELCREGDPPGDMHVVLSGRLAVEHGGESLGEIGAGEAVGTFGLFEDEPAQATVRASEASRLLRIDRWAFNELLAEHPEITRSLMSQLVRRMRTLVSQVEG